MKFTLEQKIRSTIVSKSKTDKSMRSQKISTRVKILINQDKGGEKC